MDFFDNNTSYDTLTKRLNEVQSELKEQYNKIAYLLTGLWFLVTGGFVFALIDSTDKIFIIPIGIGVIFIILTWIITIATLNSKIRNVYLNKEVINLFNFTEGTNVQYEVKPKYEKTFNSEMALYLRHASASNRYKFSSDDPNQLNFKLLNTTLVTSSGNTSTVHFDGDYLILNVPTNQQFHIKHRKAKTGTKDVKFFKIEDEEHHIYLTEEDYVRQEKRVIRPLNRQFISLYSYAKEVFQTDKINMGSNKEQIHIAVKEKIKFRVPNKFNYDNVKKYYEDFTKVIRNVNQIVAYIKDQEFL